jgi:ABC-type multidrug transport system ATPase subunit
VSVTALSTRFGDRIAFDDLAFEVAQGEVFGFLGPNGAGKTTTVRTLGTMIAPTSGSATVVGLALEPDNCVEIRKASDALGCRSVVRRTPRTLVHGDRGRSLGGPDWVNATACRG